MLCVCTTYMYMHVYDVSMYIYMYMPTHVHVYLPLEVMCMFVYMYMMYPCTCTCIWCIHVRTCSCMFPNATISIDCVGIFTFVRYWLFIFCFRTQGVKYGSLISPTATTEDLQDRSASYILSEEEVMNMKPLDFGTKDGSGSSCLY